MEAEVRAQLKLAIAQAIFMSTTHYDEPVMDGSDLDFAVWEDSERAAEAVIEALRIERGPQISGEGIEGHERDEPNVYWWRLGVLSLPPQKETAESDT